MKMQWKFAVLAKSHRLCLTLILAQLGREASSGSLPCRSVRLWRIRDEWTTRA